MSTLTGDASNNHGFSSLVLNRTRPGFIPDAGMVPSVIEISDDEDDPLRTNFIAERPSGQAEAGPSTTNRPRSTLCSSPSVHHDSKRQKLDKAGPLSTNIPGLIKTELPRVQLGLINDEDVLAQAYPNFFEEAFRTPQELDSGEEIEIVMEAPREEKEILSPYYDDVHLNIRMFRGPGFEHFPVPLELHPEQKEVCDAYDRKVIQQEAQRIQRNNAFGLYLDRHVDVEDSGQDEPSRVKRKISTTEAACLAKVLEVLPDIQHDFVLVKIRSAYESYNFGSEEIEVLPDAAGIVATILDEGDYPKEILQEPVAKDPFEDRTGKTIKLSEEHRNHRDYQTDAVIVLERQFQYVPTCYINKVMQSKKSLWHTYLHIAELESKYWSLPSKDRPYRRERKARIAIEKKYQRVDTSSRDPTFYANVVNELQAVKQHAVRESLRKDDEKQKADAETKNLEQSKLAGLITQCMICFDDETPLNRAVPCMAESAEHYFCFDCVEGLANSQIGMMKHEMLCMEPDGCKQKLSMEGVGRAIPIKTFDRLLFNEQQNEIAAAGLENLEQCPFCDFKAICDPVEVDTIFSCQNPACFRVTCRKCRETSHLPKTCEEVKKDRGLSARHRVEEARSKAMMRPCPKCKTNLIKELGCNKMRCQCGAVMCYVCKQDLSHLRDGYEHFNTSRATGTKCSLYDIPGVDRHVQEANDAELKAIRDARAEDDTIQETELQVETGTSKATQTATAHLAGAIPGPHPVVPPLPAPALAGRRARQQDHLRDIGVRMHQRAHLDQIQGLPALDGAHLAGRPALVVAPIGDPHRPGDARIDAWRRNIWPPIQATPIAGNAGPFLRNDDADRIHFENLGQQLFNQQTGQARDEAMDPFGALRHNRIRDHRVDSDRLRRFQVLRRNSARKAPATPVTVPNPANFTLIGGPQEQNQALQAQENNPQPQPEPDWAAILQHNPEAWNFGDENLGDLFADDGDYMDLADFNFAPAVPQRTNTWRDQYRPPTPRLDPQPTQNLPPPPRPDAFGGFVAPPGTGIVDRGHPSRRRTTPMANTTGLAASRWNPANAGPAVHHDGDARPAAVARGPNKAPAQAPDNVFGYDYI